AGAAIWGNCNWGGGDVDVNVNNYSNFSQSVNRSDVANERVQHYQGDRGQGDRGQGNRGQGDRGQGNRGQADRGRRQHQPGHGGASRSIAGAPSSATQGRSSASTRPAPRTCNRARLSVDGRPRGGRKWRAAACSKARWVAAEGADRQASLEVEDSSVADRPRG